MTEIQGIDPFALLPSRDALEKFDISEIELLRAAAAGKFRLCYLAPQMEVVSFKLAQLENTFDDEFLWLPIFDYEDDQASISATVEVNLGDPFILNADNIKSLLVVGSCSKYDLLAANLDTEEALKQASSTNYGGGPLRWVTDTNNEQILTISDTYVVEADIDASKDHAPQKQSMEGSKGTSNTGLKVIALFMHHLAKSPKYASGTTPNKSQIKELLLDLATELEVNPYGLSKVDERLLTDALKYLEEQKL